MTWTKCESAIIMSTQIRWKTVTCVTLFRCSFRYDCCIYGLKLNIGVVSIHVICTHVFTLTVRCRIINSHLYQYVNSWQPYRREFHMNVTCSWQCIMKVSRLRRYIFALNAEGDRTECILVVYRLQVQPLWSRVGPGLICFHLGIAW